MQKVMICTTERPDMRAPIEGWTTEDGDAVNQAWKERLGTKREYNSAYEVPVGLIRGNYLPLHPTVLHALGYGWKLLAPPTSFKEVHDTEEKGKHEVTMWVWWLVKD